MKHIITAVWILLCVFLLPVPAGAQRDLSVYYSGDPESNKIAITVDDLYEPINLRNMLDLCLKYDIHITFFTLGIVIKPEDAALWQRIEDEGHEIGNHTYGHVRITKLNSDQLGHQLRIMQEALDAVLREPYPMCLFRPPFGDFDHSGHGSLEKLGEQGYPHMVLWSAGLDDVLRNKRCVKGGSIVLFHTNWQDVQCMDELIPKLQGEGFELVTVSELLGLTAAADGN